MAAHRWIFSRHLQDVENLSRLAMIEQAKSEDSEKLAGTRNSGPNKYMRPAFSAVSHDTPEVMAIRWRWHHSTQSHTQQTYNICIHQTLATEMEDKHTGLADEMDH